MYDYKFRQSDLSFNKPERTFHKTLLRAAGVILAAGAVYGMIHLGLRWKANTSSPETDSDIIPLQLPAHGLPEESGEPIERDSDLPTEISTNRAFTEAQEILQYGGRANASAKTPRNPAKIERIARGDSTRDPPVDRDFRPLPLVENEGNGTPRSSASALPSSEDSLLRQPPAEGELVQASAEIAAAVATNETQSATQANATSLDKEDGTWIEHEVKPGDTLATIFRDNELSPQLLQRILRSGKEARHLKTIRPKNRLRIHLDRGRQFAELHFQLDALRSVKFSATDSGIKGTKIRKESETKATVASGLIDHTLFSSASKAGLPDAITMQLTKIFGWDIDFALEIRAGDRFSVIYEELWAEDKQVGTGNIIAAEFINQGHAHRAVRFKNSQGKTDYYSPEGMPLKKTFFRTPVNFTRISSGFSKRRWHPVLKRRRAHKGVDYAAPSGTPIIATGDATVEYRGWNKGYGRVVYLRHGHKYVTVYGHMSRFAKGLNKGDRVKQGEVIGYVGQSGLATGPHLHYEFRVGGVHRNPLTVKAPIADPLPRKEMKRFRQAAEPLLASLEQTASDLLVADAR